MTVAALHVALASLPLAVLLIGLLRLGWSGAQAGGAALAAAAASAALGFGLSPAGLGVALGRGVAVSLDVLYIIWAALLLERLAETSGAIRSIGAAVARLTGDRTWQLLIVGFAFSSFLQGVAGFGVPVAVTAPLLVGLGFPPVEAAAVTLVGHSWSVTFGSMASSFQALLAVTALEPLGLGAWIGVLLGLAGVASGLAVAHIHGGWTMVRRGFVPIVVLGTLMAVTQLVLVLTRQWTVSALAAGVVGLALSVALARRLPIPNLPPAVAAPATAGAVRTGSAGTSGRAANHVVTAALERASVVNPPPWVVERPPAGTAGSTALPIRMRLAFLPYALLVAIVALATFVGPLHAALLRWQATFAFPEVVTAAGWRSPAAVFRIAVFGHPGALLLYAAGLTALLYRRLGVALPSGRALWRATAEQGAPVTVTLVLLSGVAMVMTYSGMTSLLARALTGLFGRLFPFVSPFIGLLGTVITGSNTTSNLLLGALQRDGAALLAMNALVVAALQSAGGALGSMVTPAKVVLATATTGLGGREGEVMRATLRYALVLTAGLGALGAFAALR